MAMANDSPSDHFLLWLCQMSDNAGLPRFSSEGELVAAEKKVLAVR